MSSCRFCGAALEVLFADLGMSPLANSFLPIERSNEMEPFYPLRAHVCGRCFLVQLEEAETPERIFSDYAYFSSYSSSWLEHCRDYASLTVERFALGRGSHVVEIASNDGYLLQFFRQHEIPVLGIEPARNVAAAAQARGIPTRVAFFGKELAAELAATSSADLLLGNNVLAHVPDLNDFVAGLKALLAPTGVISLEFPHLMRLIADGQWDTIYHEHFSYFSLITARRVLAAHGLRLFDVEELATHGGSLRIYACHVEDDSKSTSAAVDELSRREREAGLESLDTYAGFGERVRADKRDILELLIDLKRDGLKLVGYGAPAKGNTLLNYCGVGSDFLEYTCDLNPYKQGRLLPGSHIPIHPPEILRTDQPDVIVILPWNLEEEIVEQLSFVRGWGGQFAVLTPEVGLRD